jgi:PAS domain S-box-containing protein
MAPTSREADVPASLSSAHEIEVLSRITALLQAALPLDELLGQILRGVAEGLDVERAELYMLDERDRVLIGEQAVLHHQTGDRMVSFGVAGIRIPITDQQEVLSAVALHGRTHVIDDLSRPDGDLKLLPVLRQQMGSGSFAAVPLIACGQVVGVITLNDRRPDRLPLRQRIPLLNAFAVQAGLAIERARLYEDRERAIRDLSHLQKVTAALQGSLPLADVLQRILEGVTEGLDVGRAIFFLYEPERGVLRGVQAAIRQKAEPAGDPLSHIHETIQEIEIPVLSHDEVMAATVLQRRPFVVDRTVAGHGERSPHISEILRDRLHIESFVTAPLLAHDRVVGVIAVDDLRGGVPAHARLALLMAYCAQAGLAIERTLLEEKLRASEKRSREFIEQSPDGIAETTVEGRFLSCNDGLAKLLGYTREELLAINVRDLYIEPACRDEIIAECLRKGRLEGAEAALRAKNGRAVYVSISIRLRREVGEAVLESIVRDMSERYEAQRRLRALTDVVSYSADAILSVDPDCRVGSWNVGAESIFGYAADEIIGRPYQTLVPPDLLDQFRDVIRHRVEREGHLRGFETERLRKDGRRFPVSLTITRLRHNGDPELGWSVVIRDITQRRREEQQLRLLSSITEQSPDAILSVGCDGMITSWNRGAEKIFGYSAAEIVGRPWLDLAPSDRESDYRMATAPVGQIGDGPPTGPGRSVDTIARARDNRLLPVSLSASVLRDGQGGAVGWSIILRDLTEQKSLAEMSERLQEELYSRNRLEGIVGVSSSLEDVRERIRRVARFTSSVMLVGPSGTGKEVVANAIHYNSPRRRNPLVKVNCAAIPEDLLESELFGIERNVATGVDGRMGRFEMADGGTLFLDEIGDMSLATQAKILRALQEREFERVGGKKVIKVDVRIIAATNVDLRQMMEDGRFREDLFYRLHVITVQLPPLRERKDDIPLLVGHFLKKYGEENQKTDLELAPEVLDLLADYDWPGNVRELENVIERAVVLTTGPRIGTEMIPEQVRTRPSFRLPAVVLPPEGVSFRDVIIDFEKRLIESTLETAGGVQKRAAELLRIKPTTLNEMIKRYDIRPRRRKDNGAREEANGDGRVAPPAAEPDDL